MGRVIKRGKKKEFRGSFVTGVVKVYKVIQAQVDK